MNMFACLQPSWRAGFPGQFYMRVHTHFVVKFFALKVLQFHDSDEKKEERRGERKKERKRREEERKCIKKKKVQLEKKREKVQ